MSAETQQIDPSMHAGERDPLIRAYALAAPLEKYQDYLERNGESAQAGAVGPEVGALAVAQEVQASDTGGYVPTDRERPVAELSDEEWSEWGNLVDKIKGEHPSDAALPPGHDERTQEAVGHRPSDAENAPETVAEIAEKISKKDLEQMPQEDFFTLLDEEIKGSTDEHLETRQKHLWREVSTAIDNQHQGDATELFHELFAVHKEQINRGNEERFDDFMLYRGIEKQYFNIDFIRGMAEDAGERAKQMERDGDIEAAQEQRALADMLNGSADRWQKAHDKGVISRGPNAAIHQKGMSDNRDRRDTSVGERRLFAVRDYSGESEVTMETNPSHDYLRRPGDAIPGGGLDENGQVLPIADRLTYTTRYGEEPAASEVEDDDSAQTDYDEAEPAELEDTQTADAPEQEQEESAELATEEQEEDGDELARRRRNKVQPPPEQPQINLGGQTKEEEAEKPIPKPQANQQQPEPVEDVNVLEHLDSTQHDMWKQLSLMRFNINDKRLGEYMAAFGQGLAVGKVDKEQMLHARNRALEIGQTDFANMLTRFANTRPETNVGSIFDNKAA